MSIVNRIFNGSLGITQTFLFDPWSAAAAALGSVVNAATQNRNTDKAIAAQREENERAYQRNIEQWERENDYNTPTAVAQRLRDAGMNPALAYGTPNVSSPSPTLNPTDMSGIANKRSVLGTTLESPLNQAMMQAQIRNLNADSEQKEQGARKTGAEADYQLTYNKFAEQIITGNISEQNARIELDASQTDLNDMKSRESYSNITKILAEANKIKSDIDVNQSKIDNMTEDTINKRIQNAFAEKKMQAEINLLYNQAYAAGMTGNLTKEQFSQLSQQAVYNLLTKKEMANNEYLKGVKLYNEANEIKVSIDTKQFDLSKKRDYEILNDINKTVGTFGNIMRGVIPFL